MFKKPSEKMSQRQVCLALVMFTTWMVSMIICFSPVVSKAQDKIKTYRGVVKLIVHEDENVFSSANQNLPSDNPLLNSLEEQVFTARYEYKLYTDGVFLHLGKATAVDPGSASGAKNAGYIKEDGTINWQLLVNRQVSVNAILRPTKDDQKTLVVNPQSLKVLDSSPYVELAVPPVTQGNYKVLLVVVTVQQPNGPPADPSFMTIQQALAPVFITQRSAKVFMQTASSSRLQLVGLSNLESGDAAAVTVTSTITNCDQQKLNEWPQLADTQLRAQNIEPNNYNTTFLIYDDLPGCSTRSSASIGSIGLMNSREYVFTSKFDMLSSWAEEMASHELGHTLGLLHSNAYRCTDQNNIPGSCIVREYGDQACVMGSSSSYSLPNVYQRRRLGWHEWPFKRLLYSGKYNVYSPSIPNQTGAKRLMSCQFCYITLTGSLAGHSEYIESRRSYQLFDSFTQLRLPYAQGVKLILGNDDLTFVFAEPYLIDTTPNDTSTYNAPLVLQSYSVAGVRVDHTSLTTAVSGSAVQLFLP